MSLGVSLYPCNYIFWKLSDTQNLQIVNPSLVAVAYRLCCLPSGKLLSLYHSITQCFEWKSINIYINIFYSIEIHREKTISYTDFLYFKQPLTLLWTKDQTTKLYNIPMISRVTKPPWRKVFKSHHDTLVLPLMLNAFIGKPPLTIRQRFYYISCI